MQRPCLRSLVSPVYGLCGRVGGILLFLFCFISTAGFAAVTVTTSSVGTNICSNKAVTGSAPGFTSLGTIMITEGSNADFNGAAGGITNTIVLVPPTGWQFGTTSPIFTFTSGSNVIAVTGSVTSSTLTINITANNTNGGDQVFISGLQVQATSTTSAPGNIYPTSVTGVAGISTGPSGTNFTSLSLTSPLTPSVSIAAGPAGAVCPGTNVTFTPSPVNGGTSPVYQWYVNGSSITTGATYNSNTLANGNTVSCTMISGLSCLTGTSASSNTITMTVNAAPAAITGTAITCPGSSTSLSSSTTGGTWSSGAPAVATVNSSGVVTGAVAGSAKISYTAGGCATVRTVYVNAVPSAPSLSPTSSVICSGGVVAITAAGTPLPSSILSQNFNSGISPWTVDTAGSVGLFPGAEWKSCGDGYINEQGVYHSPDNSAFAMSNSDTSGSASYTWSKLISPTFSLAGYSSATLSFQHAYEHWLAGDYNVDLEISTNGGASWSTLRSYTGSDVGMKTAFSADTISLNAYLGYSSVKVRFNYYCHWGYYWAVDNVMITGISSIVYPAWTPSATLYTDPALTTPYTPGSLANVVYASPTSVGTTSVVTYTATATIPGCSSLATSVLTVNPLPGTITGALNTCTSTTTSLTNTVGGGTWSSSNTSVASISSMGVATGLTPGTSTINYSTGVCAATAVLTVNVTPAAIAGSSGVCIASTSTLTDATTGGTWSSGNTAVATIGSTSGIVSGLTLGTAVITYSLGVGCTATKTITVNALPAVITGTAVVCQGQTTTLSDATAGGTWSSSATSIATVASTTGIVTGVSGGIATITYTSATGCIAATNVTVNPLASITGALNVCIGLTTSLSNVNSGGSWFAATSLAWVSSFGVVTGIGAGTAVVSYALPTGCTATAVLTINSLPASITGTTSVCVGSVTTLSDASPGGSWSTDNAAVGNATSATGVVGGVTAGSVNVTYTLPTGCIATTVVTVNPLPDTIIGSNTACMSPSVTLSNATTGGTWSSGNTSVAAVGVTTGIVIGAGPGIVTISYTLPTTCSAVKTLTMYPLPASITGTLSVCVGSTTTLTDPTGGGTWSSSDPAVGTVSMTTGAVTGTSPGTLTITYTLPTGCYTARTFTVNGLPDAISGPSSVCLAATITLANTVAGGSWFSGFSNVSVSSGTGAVTGISSGTAVITYSLSTGCFTTKTITVNSLPAAISGPSSVCAGSTIVLTDATPGGTWSSSNTAAGTINATGVVYGLGSDTTTISYTLITGCRATSVVTVYLPPASIGGSPPYVCLGSSITMTDGTPGGTWSSGNVAIAVVGSSSGIVTGYTIGATTITYMMSSSCFVVRAVTVNSLPLAISGPGAVCSGYSILLTDITPGGSWSSSNTSVATVGSSTGVVAGVATGPAVITYTLPTGCLTTKNVSVYPTPAVITGTTGICQGSATTLSDATTGGVWSVGTPSVATVSPTTGVVTGLTPGTTLVSYTLGSCYAITTVTVNVVPPAIVGTTGICQGVVTPLFNSVAGGSWISTSSIVIVGAASGIVTGIGVGTTTISYILPTGCYVTTPFTVNALPAAIAGPTSLCVGSSAFYTNTTTGGSWSSSNPSVAGINTSGLGIAYAVGSTTISYTTAASCGTSIVLSVTPIPSPITGSSTVCESMTTTLSSASPGGTWSSGNTSVATVGTGGIVSGIVAGTANIIYTLGGCTVTKVITVNAAPQPITGATSICFGLNTTLSSLSSGGAWSSSVPGVAAIGASSGIAVAVSPGATTITYTLGGCIITAALVVNTVTPITGPSTICSGSVATLSNSTSGGSWASSNSAIAAIDATSGGVIGMGTGTSGITYTMLSGCKAVATLSVNAGPASITGAMHVCPSFTTTLTDVTPGGSWSSSVGSIATVGSASGAVTGMSSGTTFISYTLPNGCAATTIFTTDAIPPAITGGPNACVGASTLLNNAAAPGTWVSGNTAVAGVNATSGLVIGYSPGTSTITFTSSAGCSTTLVISVNSAPAAITGPSSVCQGQTLTLADITPGGSWSSSNTTIAAVGTSGVVFGAGGGIATISYTLSSGCSATKTVSVNTLPSPITGAPTACVGSSTALSNATTGGTWTSSNITIATVGYTSGIVNGVSAGPAIITYTPTSGCITTIVVTVNTSPSAISGTASVCVASTSTLTDASPGGTWSSSNTTFVMVGSSSGIVTGVTAGTAVVTYTAGAGCWAVVTVTTHPSPIGISGPASACVGASLTLADITPGGSWSSTNTSAGTIGSATGILSAIAQGTTTISYTIGTGCAAVRILTVNPVPAGITGASAVCVGASITLANTVLGGSWSSSNTSIATAGSSSGIIGGVASGTTMVTYMLPAGCYTVTTVTVNPLPASISGTLSICPGYVSSLSSTPGGLWSSSNAAAGTINATTGAAIGISSGATIISYILPTGCATSAVLTVNVLSPITGAAIICAGQSTSLNNAMGSGTWSSSNVTVAFVGSTTGIVTGNIAGTAIITFTYTAGCKATKIVTVSALSPITGSGNVCIGIPSTLSNAATGGIWTSVNPSIAAINTSTGVVTGVSTGTTTITYTYGSGCSVTTTVTVNSVPASISGPSNVCATDAITLTNVTPGGAWSTAGYTTVATVGATTGVLTGVAAGTAVASYILPTGCYATSIVTVSALPSVIGGIAQVCVTSTTMLTNTSVGGSWSSSNTAVATIDASSGVVSGINPGTTSVTYLVASGCLITTIVTVNALPSAITGSLALCIGSSSSLSSATASGLWSSGNTAVATIGSSTGMLSGVGSGTSVITYMMPTGCGAIAIATVNALPDPVTGPNKVCVAATVTLSSTPVGGTWSTTATDLSVGVSDGIVSGINAGTATITYSIGTGCFTTYAVTINPLPAGITGTFSICEGTTTTLADITTGGTWSSSGPVAGINPATGVVTAFISGTAPVTYTLPSGCYRTATVTVNALPAPIVGPTSVCTGQTIALSDITPGGTWSSGAPGIATVNTGGMVTGVAAGNATITYTSSAGCIATKSITVNPSPAAITGTAAVCEGLTTTLFNTTAAGTWSSDNTAVATISATGIVAGIVAGTSVVSYTLPTGCATVIITTVNPLPASISGPATVCSGSTVALSNASVGGSWTSSNLSAATVGASSGDVTGFTPLPVTITYTLPTGCMAIKSMTVNPVPATITGTAAVCQGYTTTLSDVTPAGTWSSVIPGIASVSAAGVVTGMSDGTATISYTLANGCAATLLYTVHPLAPITGPANACQGQTTNLNNLVTGGSWSSSNIATATVGSVTGAVYGVALGTATISYLMPTGCLSTKNITVNPVPAPITGASSACMGATIVLSNTTPGGMWSSSGTTVAPVSSTGVVSGLSAGSAMIVYALSTGCASYAAVTINPLYPIGGSSNICGNDTMTFTNAAPAGVWSSTTSGVASINATTGLLTGVAPGTTLIRYLLSTGCLASLVVTVNTPPSVFSMTGGGSFCVGGPGVPVGLNSSSPAVSYKLFNGSSLVSSYLGTGSAISFGVFTVVGTYTVLATNTATGCTRNMSGAAVVSVLPYNTPSVSVTTTTSGAICPGLPATFVPVAAFPGSAPVYVWRVNGVITGFGGSYSYVPASGDVVLCKMTSSAACLSTDTASGFMTVSLTVPSVPAVSIASTPGDTMCPLTTVTLTPTPVNGGSAPWYNWVVNGLSAGVSPTFSYAPLNGDNVYCVMHSNQYCITSDTVSSNHKIYTVFPATSPTVAISASPGLTIAAGTSDTLTAMISGGGMAPTYQWLLNGAAIPGATTATYISASFANGDAISCIVTNTDMCAGAPDTSKVILTVKTSNNNHVGIATANGLTSTLYLVPNPNTGVFTLHGPTGYEGEINIEVTDLLGQTVYNAMLNSQGRPVSSRIVLDSRLANGMYILNVYVGGERHSLHFVIEK